MDKNKEKGRRKDNMGKRDDLYNKQYREWESGGDVCCLD
jgi:hypothetical protein